MYHYIDSGLDNIYLQNGYKVSKTPYGGAISISHLDDLHKAIGMAIATSLKRMSPKEMRFLRLEMELSQKRLAALLNVDSQSIARWEKGQTSLPGPAELLIRGIYIEHAGGNSDIVKLCQDLAELDEVEFAERREFAGNDGDWRLVS